MEALATIPGLQSMLGIVTSILTLIAVFIQIGKIVEKIDSRIHIEDERHKQNQEMFTELRRDIKDILKQEGKE